MIIGMEFSKTTTETGKNFYRIAPVVLGQTPRTVNDIKTYTVASVFIFAFAYLAYAISP